MSVDPDLMVALVGVESSFNPNATSYDKQGRPVARGLAQVIDANTNKLSPGEDPYDPEVSVRNGWTILNKEHDTFQDPWLAVAAYNAGPERVKNALLAAQKLRNEGVEIGLDADSLGDERLGDYRLPLETRNHVVKVRNAYNTLKAQQLDETKQIQNSDTGEVGTLQEFKDAALDLYTSPQIEGMSARNQIKALNSIWSKKKWAPEVDALINQAATDIWNSAGPNESPIPSIVAMADNHLAAVTGDTEEAFNKSKEEQKTAFKNLLLSEGINAAFYGDQIDKAFDAGTEEQLTQLQTRNRGVAGDIGQGVKLLAKGLGTPSVSIGAWLAELEGDPQQAKNIKENYAALFGPPPREWEMQTNPDGSVVRVKGDARGKPIQRADGTYIPDPNGVPIPRSIARNIELIGSLVPLAGFGAGSLAGGAAGAISGTAMFGINGVMGAESAYSEARDNGGTHEQGLEAMMWSLPTTALATVVERSALGSGFQFLKTMSGKPLYRALALTADKFARGAAGMAGFDWGVYEAAHLATGKGEYTWDRAKQALIEGGLVFGTIGAGLGLAKGEYRTPAKDLTAEQKTKAAELKREGTAPTSMPVESTTAVMPDEATQHALVQKLDTLRNSRATGAIIDLPEGQELPPILTEAYGVDATRTAPGKVEITKRTSYVPEAVDETNLKTLDTKIKQLERETLAVNDQDILATPAEAARQDVTALYDMQAKIKEKERLQTVAENLRMQQISKAEGEGAKKPLPKPVIPETAYRVRTSEGEKFIVPHEDKFYVTDERGRVLSRGFTYPSEALKATKTEEPLAAATGASWSGHVLVDPIPWDNKPILHAKQIREKLQDIFNLPISMAKNLGRTSAGEYHPNIPQILMRFRNDSPTAWHEFMHHLDDITQMGNDKILSKEPQAAVIEKSLMELSKGGSGQLGKGRIYDLKEGAAELARGWAVNPEYMLENHPEAVEYLKRRVPAELLSKLEDLGHETRRYQGAPPEEKIAASMHDPNADQVLKDERNFVEKWNPFKMALRLFQNEDPTDLSDTVYDKYRRAMLTQIGRVEKLIGKYQKEDEVLPSDNVAYAVFQWLGVGGRQQGAMERGIPDLRSNQPSAVLPKTKGGVVKMMAAPVEYGFSGKDIDRVHELAFKKGIAEATLAMHDERTAALVQAEENAIKLAAKQGRGKITDADIAAEYKKLTNIKSYGPLTGIAGGSDSSATGSAEVPIAKKFLQEWSKHPENERLAADETLKRIRDWGAGLLKYLRDSEVLPDEVYQKLLAKQDTYLPLHRFIQEKTFDSGSVGHGLGNPTQTLKARRGSSAEILNPFESLMKLTDDIIREGDKNRTMLQLTNLFTSPYDRHMYEKLPDKGTAVVRVNANQKDLPNVFTHYENGKQVYTMWHPDIAKDLDAMTVHDSGSPLEQGLSKLAAISKWGVTHAPKFITRNFNRDWMDRLLYSDAGVKNTLKATAESVKNVARVAIPGLHEKYADAEADLMLNYGDQAGHYYKARDAYSKIVDKALKQLQNEDKTILFIPKNKFPSLSEIVESSEKVGRIAEMQAQYQKGLEMGLSPKESMIRAGVKAANIMNFLVSGTIMRRINRLIPFTNAGVQGIRKHVGTAFKGDTALEKARSFAKFEAKVALFGALPLVLSRMWNESQGADEEYEKLPWWRRDMFYNVRVGDHWLMWPKGFAEIVETAFVDRAYSKLQGKKNAFAGLHHTLANQFIPFGEDMIIPTGMQGLVGSLTNYDFFKQQPVQSVYTEGMALDMLPENKHSSSIGKGIQKFLVSAGLSDNWAAKKFGSAEKIDYALGKQFGTMGEYMLALSNAVTGEQSFKKLNADTLLGFSQPSNAYVGTDYNYIRDYARAHGIASNNAQFERLNSLMQKYNDASTDKTKALITQQVLKESARIREGMEKHPKGALSFFGKSLKEGQNADIEDED